MLIDWFTVAAQAINFLILVWLLKRFLYQPILRAIDAREKRIASELADAAAQKTEAQKARDEFTSKNHEFDQQRASLLNQATEAANAERRRLMDDARKESDIFRAKQQDEVRNNQQTLWRNISRRTQEEIFAVAQKTLSDLAGANLEQQIIGVFIRKLHELDGAQREKMESALKVGTGPLIVRSTFALSTQLRSDVENTVKEVLGEKMQIQFETAPELVAGVELTANGQKVSWSIAEYLKTMKSGIAEILDGQLKPEPSANPHVTPVLESEQGAKKSGT
jgi:F-type H+-transporting ATPase subunit b